MNAPPVQYVRTTDGYDIAYSVSGQGRPLVFLPQTMSHIQMYWTEDTWVRPWLTRLAERFQLVQYDGRGQGLSRRGLPDTFSLYDEELDLEAVVERLGLRKFTLMAVQSRGHTAIRYAVANPDRVEALVLVSCLISLADWPLALLAPLSEQDWDAFLRSLAGLSSAKEIEGSVRRQKQAITQADYVTISRAERQSNISDWLPRLATPTLVLHPRQSLNMPPEESMRLAAAIPNAQMVLIDGATPLGDSQQGVEAIERFAAEAASRPAIAKAPEPARGDAGNMSVREIEVLRLLAAGKSNQQIADELVISPNTAIRHVSNIFAKIGVENRAQAAVYARDHGLG